MVYIRLLKEKQNVIKMFRVTHPHGFLVLEAPEPKGGCSQVIAEKYTSEEAKVSEEVVRRKGGGGGPRELGMSQGWRGRGARVECGRVCGR